MSNEDLEITPIDDNIIQNDGDDSYSEEPITTPAAEFSHDVGSVNEDSNMTQDYKDEQYSVQNTPVIEETDYVEYTGEETQDTSKEQPQEKPGFQHRTKAQVDSTLWMTDMSDSWDDEFIKKAFDHFDYKVLSVKIVNDKVKPEKRYAFIEFESAEIARKVLLKVNGRTIPNDADKKRFHLSYANMPNEVTVEYCLSISNLSSSLTDVDLFKLFAKKYTSCRSAKIHYHPNGQSKGFGVVKFHSQTEQQLALVEFNKYNFRGREIYIKLAPPKTRGPKGLIANMNQVPGLYGAPGFMPNALGTSFGTFSGGINIPDLGNRSSGRNDRRSRRSRSRDRDRRRDRRRSRSRSTSKERKRRYWRLDEFVKDYKQKVFDESLAIPAVSWVQDDKPWPVDEYNEKYMLDSEKCQVDLNAGKYSSFIINANWKLEDVVKSLYPETLVPEVEE